MNAEQRTACFCALFLGAACSGCNDPVGAPIGDHLNPGVDAQMARHTADLISLHKKEVDGSIAQIDSTVAEVKRAEQAKKLEEVTALRDAADRGIAAAHNLSEHLLLVDRELRHAEGAFRAAAASYRGRAGDFTDAKLKGSAMEWAAHYDALAAGCPAERQRMARLHSNVSPTLAMLREARLHLSDYAMYIGTYSGGTVPEHESARYLAAVQSFVREFSTFEAAADSHRQSASVTPPPAQPVSRIAVAVEPKLPKYQPSSVRPVVCRERVETNRAERPSIVAPPQVPKDEPPSIKQDAARLETPPPAPQQPAPVQPPATARRATPATLAPLPRGFTTTTDVGIEVSVPHPGMLPVYQRRVEVTPYRGGR